MHYFALLAAEMHISVLLEPNPTVKYPAGWQNMPPCLYKHEKLHSRKAKSHAKVLFWELKCTQGLSGELKHRPKCPLGSQNVLKCPFGR